MSRYSEGGQPVRSDLEMLNILSPATMVRESMQKIIWSLKKGEVQRAISDCSVHENAETHTTSNILVLFISLILYHNSIIINLASGAFEDFQDPVEGSRVCSE